MAGRPSKNRNLKQDFLEQWDFLRWSMTGYDSGREHEAKRLATTIRVLVHDEGKGTGLLTQLGVKDNFDWPHSGGGVNPANLATTMSLTSFRHTTLAEGFQVAYVPRSINDITTPPFAAQPVVFEQWWNLPVIKDSASREFSRRDLILMLANRHGGAHIASLTPGELVLDGGTSMGVGVGFDDETTIPVELSVVPASVRTIANEIEVMFCTHAEKLGLPLLPGQAKQD